MGDNGGCKCHGETFCPDEVFVGYEDDVPVFEKRKDSQRTKRVNGRDVPVIPPLPEPPDPSEVVAVCGLCGMHVTRGPMFISCNRLRCPVFPRHRMGVESKW